ncbi:MAG: HAD family hydrolase [Sphingobacteriales bacterium]|nr:MAG: HAD family hydrolase [Sphingobacteriales bacterium]
MLTKEKNTVIIKQPVKKDVLCYHCGTPCITKNISLEDKVFCCEGCKLVYEIINNNGLCDYYSLQSHPGLSQIKATRQDKYAYLDNEDIARKFYSFTDGNHTITTFYIPGIHCTSCMWLMEHMHRLNEGINSSRLNFTSKEVTIHFRKDKIAIRQVVELLCTIGYEPYISLEDADDKKAEKKYDKQKIYKLGIAGFCFGNIMMMSFPEYLSHSSGIDHQYAQLFRMLNLVLALPVFFYSATEFFASAWAGVKQRVLNIDAPIVLALLITFTRSIYEIATNTGGGYLDSMSGIVFFMLVGRVVQERTYRSISFHRDYKSYFPIAVNVVTATGIESRSIQGLKEKDVVELHNEEIVPADAIVLKGKASIDYSFVTGESEPVVVKEGEVIYAGGKQVGEQITLQVIKPVAGSYLTSLWNHHAFTKNKIKTAKEHSVVHMLSRYFTIVLFTLAAVTGLYWAVNDPAKILPSVSAMLIVACPCALLLAATYTDGNLLRIFSNNGLFLRDAVVIEELGKIDQIVFDKTGTLTQGTTQLVCTGHQLGDEEKSWVYNVAVSSKHPYSKALVSYLGQHDRSSPEHWKETEGKGLDAVISGNKIMIGSADYLDIDTADNEKANLYVRVNDKVTAFYIVPLLRDGLADVIPTLEEQYQLSLLSGDNDRQRAVMQQFFKKKTDFLFSQKPADKLNYIEQQQQAGYKVLMMGDGLNDAGALQQSNVGITLADDVNNFTPSCDAILDAKKFKYFPQLLKLAKSGRVITNISFVISILYNIVGLYISVQGRMSPMVAAILMPVSTLSIVLITTGLSSLRARMLGLSLKS